MAAEGLSLPVALAPPGAADLTPSKIELDGDAKGIDIAAAANEAIADMRLDRRRAAHLRRGLGQGSRSAFLSAGPLELELAPSHMSSRRRSTPTFRAPCATTVGKPSGAMTIRMRGFDKTMAAIKALGPDVAAKSIPGLAMAKGLAKTESDGSLSWLVEFGPDRSIKINGVPLGRAPE